MENGRKLCGKRLKMPPNDFNGKSEVYLYIFYAAITRVHYYSAFADECGHSKILEEWNSIGIHIL
jgi:hypothetical protein